MQVLFVHGMGRSPVSGWPLLWQLRRAGLKTHSFGYAVSLERFDRIVGRLSQCLAALPADEELVLVGHSLGGVLLRAALQSGKPPSATQLFLLGSPVQPSQMAQRLSSNPLFRGITRDCGDLLGSAARMAAIGAPPLPTTGIAGVRGLTGPLSPFGEETNDGVVSLSEVSASWLAEQVQLPVVHTLLPSSPSVGQVILERLRR